MSASMRVVSRKFGGEPCQIILTGGSKRVTGNRRCGIASALDNVHEGSYRSFIARVDSGQDTLQRKVLVKIWVSILVSSANSSESQKLRDQQQALLRFLLGSGYVLGLGCVNRLLQLFLSTLVKTLLKVGLLGRQSSLVFLVELFVLHDLIFQLRQRCLQRGLLQYLCLLVRVDLASNDQLVKGLTWVLGEDVIDFGCTSLEMRLV